ncbi:thiamine pyrophosphate-dependent enzyme [Candidatus Phyllobacterium onerii]|uniref:thiamine pyrophosphate-dependent enzyme n=1 Tax=Candidatus Phyllobacterium onerii TaxID=3020828 RepID=UPI00232E0922|nr:thiamine pyrophosphate-dependent enzyme [Phyllobacterium sp. IY22]
MANTADILIETLLKWDVEVMFGLPGDGINGIMESLRKRQKEIRFVQVRHEATAAFMATAYGKWTGKLGVCLATSGPGGTNLLTGLYDAKLDQVAVLAITGMQFHDLNETFTQQDVNLIRVFDDVSVYNAQVSDAAHVENVTSLACRSAYSKRGVSHISIANDVQEQSAEESARSKRNKPGHVSNDWFRSNPVPTDDEIASASAILNSSSKIAILIGNGARGAATEVTKIAEKLGAPIIKALLGKDVLPDDHPYTTGGIGILGTAASQEVMESCDALLIVGSSFPYVEYYPRPGQARCLQIDVDGQRIGLRCPVEVGLVGDAASTIRLLLEHLKDRIDMRFLDESKRKMHRWRQMIAELEADTSLPMKPQTVVGALGKMLPEDAVVVADSGQNTELAARHVTIRGGQRFSVSGSLASMACGLPYALAAGIAFPGRPVFAIVGDGGLAMQLGEFSTAVSFDIPLKVLVIKNGMLNQIAWEQMMFLGNPQFACELAEIDFAKAAEAMGGKGYTIKDPARIQDILSDAMSHSQPTIIEAVVDKYEPLMPPKMPKDYRRNFEKALADTPGAECIRRNISRKPVKGMYNGG